jgi:glycosyltransferase involved in cell wall biosynthesis
MKSPAGRLSVIVITLNEERNIRECLASVSWADELIVVDAESSDSTVAIAREFTSHVFVRKWEGYSGAKAFGVSRASNPWILWLDADERVSEDLAASIQRVISSGSAEPPVHEVSRRAIFLGRWIKHSGWYPGYVSRLFLKERAKFTTAGVHEKLDAEGKPGRLKGDLIHYTDDNLFHYFAKYNTYTSLAAAELQKLGRRASLSGMLFRPPYQFLKMYVIRLGFLDGIHGLILSIASATYVFVKYAKLWERKRIASD